MLKIKIKLFSVHILISSYNMISGWVCPAVHQRPFLRSTIYDYGEFLSRNEIYCSTIFSLLYNYKCLYI